MNTFHAILKKNNSKFEVIRLPEYLIRVNDNVITFHWYQTQLNIF
jgi:hypothetical protein